MMGRLGEVLGFLERAPLKGDVDVGIDIDVELDERET